MEPAEAEKSPYVQRTRAWVRTDPSVPMQTVFAFSFGALVSGGLVWGASHPWLVHLWCLSFSQRSPSGAMPRGSTLFPMMFSLCLHVAAAPEHITVQEWSPKQELMVHHTLVGYITISSACSLMCLLPV